MPESTLRIDRDSVLLEYRERLLGELAEVEELIARVKNPVEGASREAPSPRTR
ncbi:MAG TPA: hypothetical protein VFK32_07695 [Tepidiformaceae bacterium]|nr:hypothetical protein [Tepidiformaceae bacterium]